MQTYLCLAIGLGAEGKITPATKLLTLESKDNYEMDKYTSSNFEGSEDIRNNQLYQSKINEFMNANQSLVEAIRVKTGMPNYRGQVVLINPFQNDQNELEYQKRRVLFKKHLRTFNALCKDRGALCMIVRQDYHIFSPFMNNLILKERSLNHYNRTIASEFNSCKHKQTYYEMVRHTLKTYDNIKTITVDNQFNQNTNEIINNSYIPSKYGDAYEGDFIPDIDEQRLYDTYLDSAMPENTK